MDRDRAALRGRLGRAALVGVPLVFLLAFFVYPVASIVVTSLRGEDGGLSAFADVLARQSLRQVAWFTVWQAALSTVVTVVVALPGAYVFARYDFPGKALARALVTVPFVLPTVVVGTAFLALVGPRGATGVDLQGTVWAILLAHVFYNYAVVVRTVGGLWSHLDPRVEEAARVLGAGPVATFWHVTLPRLRPALAAASAIVFLFTFTSFGVILILGDLRYATLEVEIWRQTVAFTAFGVAAALAVLQLVGVGVILTLYSRYQQRTAAGQRLRPAAEVARPPRRAGERAMVAVNLGFMAVLLGAPLAVLIERSLRTAGGYGFGFYRALGEAGRGEAFVAPTEAVVNSLGFALVAAAIALVIGLMAAAVVAYRRGRVSRWFDALLMLPLGTSAVTIGFGFLVALDWPVDLRTSMWLIPLAHALVAIPFVVRVAAPVMRSVEERLREAAAVLGASPARAWREVDLPLVSRAALVGAGFALAVSLGEFGATAFLARPDRPTMPIAIFRLLGRPGQLSFGQAMAMSVVLMAVTAAAILAVDRFRVAGLGEF